MKGKLFAVGVVKDTITLEHAAVPPGFGLGWLLNAAQIPLSWSKGQVGALAVFKTKEDALAYLGVNREELIIELEVTLPCLN